MGPIFGRIGSILLVAGVYVLLGVRFVLDLIGYSTIPEDVGVAQTRLDQSLGWILSLPWWAPWGSALIATMGLMWVSWPRQNKPSVATSLNAGQRRPPDKYILANLVRFFSAGNQIMTRPVKTDAELILWELMRQNWHNEVNTFIFDRISEIEGNKLRYVCINTPLKFDTRYNDKHNRYLNIMQECLNYIEKLIERYSDRRTT